MAGEAAKQELAGSAHPAMRSRDRAGHSKQRRKVSTVEHDLLATEIARRIDTLILKGVLRPGEKLRQEAIAQQFGVSRTPVRAALLVLEAKGLLTVERGRGAMVRRVTRTECSESYLVRAELEALAASLAAQQATKQQLEALLKANEELERWEKLLLEGINDDGDPAGGEQAESTAEEDPRIGWIDANDRFHDLLLEAARCGRLTDTLNYVLRSLPRAITWLGIEHDVHIVERYRLDHSQIIECLTRRDGEAARQVAHNHVMRARELMLAWIETVDEGVIY